MTSVQDLVFESDFTTSLTADSEVGPRIRSVDAAFARVEPSPVADPRLVGFSEDTAAMIGLEVSDRDRPLLAAVLGGNAKADGMDPYSMSYGGHQFGNWAGQLGDGRAIALGEVKAGDRLYTLALKGSGVTPFSRGADGRAVLRSSIREFLCSEAMHHLGIKTTRALSLVLTGDEVMRDMFYDGNAALEPGAIVCRVSESFVRFGNFELPTSRENLALLAELANYVIDRHYPQRGGSDGYDYSGFFADVVERTADLVVEWDRVGFVHGVLNTDNMSILGETIDYGPYGWLDNYDPGWTPNTTDAQNRRYRFGNQAGIAQWNLIRLANALFPLVGSPEPFQLAIESFVERYNSGFESMMLAKLGLDNSKDPKIIRELTELLAAAETDFTIFFRGLSGFDPESVGLPAFLTNDALYGGPASLDVETEKGWADWFEAYSAELANETRSADERQEAMNRVNPKFVLRNYLAQQAIDAAHEGDYSEFDLLFEVIRRPYDEQPGNERFAAKRPDWARSKAGCSQLSCSS